MSTTLWCASAALVAVVVVELKGSQYSEFGVLRVADPVDEWLLISSALTSVSAALKLM
jgi:hypothetical protein